MNGRASAWHQRVWPLTVSLCINGLLFGTFIHLAATPQPSMDVMMVVELDGAAPLPIPPAEPDIALPEKAVRTPQRPQLRNLARFMMPERQPREDVTPLPIPTLERQPEPARVPMPRPTPTPEVKPEPRIEHTPEAQPVRPPVPLPEPDNVRTVRHVPPVETPAPPRNTHTAHVDNSAAGGNNVSSSTPSPRPGGGSTGSRSGSGAPAGGGGTSGTSGGGGTGSGVTGSGEGGGTRMTGSGAPMPAGDGGGTTGGHGGTGDSGSAGPGTPGISLAVGEGEGDGTAPGGARGESRPAGVARKPEPPYPPLARDEGVEGIVHFRLSIDARGGLTGISLTRSSGDRRLDRAAEQTIRREWSFLPALEEGVAVPSTIPAAVRFRLR